MRTLFFAVLALVCFNASADETAQKMEQAYCGEYTESRNICDACLGELWPTARSCVASCVAGKDHNSCVTGCGNALQVATSECTIRVMTEMARAKARASHR